MKKAFLLLILIFSTAPVSAFQDFIILTEQPVKFVYSADRNIATVKPLYTIGNERNILILHCLSVGKTKINVNFGETEKVLKVKINEKDTKISAEKGFEYIPVDEPPQELEILEPPLLGGHD